MRAACRGRQSPVSKVIKTNLIILPNELMGPVYDSESISESVFLHAVLQQLL